MVGIIRYALDRPTGVVLLYEEGSIAVDDILAAMRRVVSDPDVPRPYRLLVDLRAISALDLPMEDARKVVEVGASVAGATDAWVAEVAPTDYLFGVCRQLQFLAEGTPLRVGVFRTLEPAAEWLGLDPATAEAHLAALREMG